MSSPMQLFQQNPFVQQFQAGVEGLQRFAAGALQLPGHLRDAQLERAVAPRKQRAAPRRVVLRDAAAFGAIIPGDSVVEQVVTTGFLNFLNLYNSVLVVRLVLTWFPSVPEAISSPIATVCDPYLNLFRGIIPPLGGTLDLSPVLAFVLLNFATSTAAALPAEVGADGSYKRPARQPAPGALGWMQSKADALWAKRLEGQKAAREARRAAVAKAAAQRQQ